MKLEFLILLVPIMICFSCAGEGVELGQTDTTNTTKETPKQEEVIPVKEDQLPTVCDKKINADELEELIERVDEGFMPDEKLRIAKRECKKICMTSNQIRDIVSSLSDPDTQLNFSKFAYRRVLDKENYDRVAGAISFPIHKKQLKDFVRTSEE